MDRPEKFPDWATDGTPGQIVEPSQGEKDLGWEEGNAPPAQFFNYWQNLLYQWVVNQDERELVRILSSCVIEQVPLLDSVAGVAITSPKPGNIPTALSDVLFTYCAACGPDGSDQVLAIRWAPGQWTTYSVTTAEALRCVATSKNPGEMIALAAGDTGRWLHRDELTNTNTAGTTMDSANPNITDIAHDPVNDCFWAVGANGVYQFAAGTWTEIDTTFAYSHVLPLSSGRVLFYSTTDNTVYRTDDQGATAFDAGPVLANDITSMVYDEASDRVVCSDGDDIVVLSGDGESSIGSSTNLGETAVIAFSCRDRACLTNETTSSINNLLRYKSLTVSTTPADWQALSSLNIQGPVTPNKHAKIRGDYGGLISMAAGSFGTSLVAIHGNNPSGL